MIALTQVEGKMGAWEKEYFKPKKKS